MRRQLAQNVTFILFKVSVQTYSVYFGLEQSGLPSPSLVGLLTQGLDLGLLYCKQILYHPGHLGSPIFQLDQNNWRNKADSTISAVFQVTPRMAVWKPIRIMTPCICVMFSVYK